MSELAIGDVRCAPAARRRRSPAPGLGAMCLGFLMIALDATIVNVALGPIVSALGGSRRRPRTQPQEARMTVALPTPVLRRVYRVEATLAAPLALGAISQGRRRIVALSGGTFTGPELSGTLLPGGSADWQILLDDGTALGDIRYTLQTEGGDLLYVQSRSVRHGPPEVLARLGRGEEVAPDEYTFRTATQIETAAPHLDWLNKGVFVGVGGRQPAGVVYEVYLVE